MPWFDAVRANPVVQTLAWSLVAGLIGFLWGLSEIVGAFKNETGRALRTNGAWLLILLNFAASAVVYLLVASIVVGGNGWVTAIMVGLAWPTLIRNLTFKLAQPLNSEGTGDAFAVRFEQAYASVQALARQLINAALTRERMKLMVRATELSLPDLEKRARLAVVASPLAVDGDGGSPNEYIDRILQNQASNDIKKAMLAAFILQSFDRTTLDEMLKERRQPTKPAS